MSFLQLWVSFSHHFQPGKQKSLLADKQLAATQPKSRVSFHYRLLFILFIISCSIDCFICEFHTLAQRHPLWPVNSPNSPRPIGAQAHLHMYTVFFGKTAAHTQWRRNHLRSASFVICSHIHGRPSPLYNHAWFCFVFFPFVFYFWNTNQVRPIWFCFECRVSIPFTAAHFLVWMWWDPYLLQTMTLPKQLCSN